jgi:hypothetical protein
VTMTKTMYAYMCGLLLGALFVLAFVHPTDG